MINIFWDVETDGLYHEWEDKVATRVDCSVALVEYAGRQCWYEDWAGRVDYGCKSTVIGHNIFDFDLPIMEKLEGWKYDILPDRLNGQEVKFVDTMLLSKLLNPDRDYPVGYTRDWKPAYVGQKMPGPHSLDVWAYRVGMKKPQLVYGDNIGNVPREVSVAQCKSDVEILRATYYALMKEAKSLGLNLKIPLHIEQAVRFIMTKGATEGVYFDEELAEKCIPELDQLMEELALKVEAQLPSRPLPKSKTKFPPKNYMKKDDTPNEYTLKYFGKALYKEGDIWYVTTMEEESAAGTWRKSVPLKEWPHDKPFGDQSEPMKMANQDDIKNWLIKEHGWKPTLWNLSIGADGKKKRTSPKFHQSGKICENLERLAEVVPVIKDIRLWLSYRNRRNVIKSDNGTGWLNHPRLRVDHRLPADADTIGAGTFRMTHRVVANVPRKTSTYGEKMRSLFCAPPGKVMVGWDASQLEDRCKAHYCYNQPGGEAYAAKILDPDFDVHTENAENWHMERNATKNGHYALQYNCQPPKLAETLGIDIELAEQYWNDWWDRNEPLKYFMMTLEDIWKQYNKEWLPGIDGRLVPTRKKHALANTIMQSAGAIAMKYAMVLWYSKIRDLGIPATQVIHYHDEAVAITDPEYADQVGKLGQWSIKKAGEYLNFRLPLLSEYSVGHSWLDVH